MAVAQKSTKALIMNAALGGGSEMAVDVAAGVDWTAILACIMAIQQVRGRAGGAAGVAGGALPPMHVGAQDGVGRGRCGV